MRKHCGKQPRVVLDEETPSSSWFDVPKFACDLHAFSEGHTKSVANWVDKDQLSGTLNDLILSRARFWLEEELQKPVQWTARA